MLKQSSFLPVSYDRNRTEPTHTLTTLHPLFFIKEIKINKLLTSFSEVPQRVQVLHSIHCHLYVSTLFFILSVNCRHDGCPETKFLYLKIFNKWAKRKINFFSLIMIQDNLNFNLLKITTKKLWSITWSSTISTRD